MTIIPPPKYGQSNKYDFARLKQYGDSVFIKCTHPPKVREAAYKYAKYHGFLVATRIEHGGVRVYRSN